MPPAGAQEGAAEREPPFTAAEVLRAAALLPRVAHAPGHTKYQGLDDSAAAAHEAGFDALMTGADPKP